MLRFVRRHRFAVLMLAGFALPAVIAMAVSRPAPPRPSARLSILATETWRADDPQGEGFANTEFEDQSGKRIDLMLGGKLPPPDDHWHLAEVNEGLRQGSTYVVVQHDQTGDRVVYWTLPRLGESNPPLRPPIQFPRPPWPGVGCVGIMADPKSPKALVWVAILTGGAYTSDRILGTFHVGDALPGAWGRWRVKEIVNRVLPPPFDPHRSGMEAAVILVNDKTGRDEAPAWSWPALSSTRTPARCSGSSVRDVIDLPHDAPLMTPATPRPATQPAATFLPPPVLECDRVAAGKAEISVVGGNVLGWSRMNDLLPNPYDQWRVYQFLPAWVDKETGVVIEAGVTIRNTKPRSRSSCR